MNSPVLAWWFSASTYRLANTGTRFRVGHTNIVTGKIIPCEHGLHGSLLAIDALKYAPGSNVIRGLFDGTVVEHNNDKIACSRRTPLVIADATMLLQEFAYWCARTQWDLLTDQRSRTAIETKARWIRGEATDTELAAARDAAWAATRDASAASAAARDAARYASAASASDSAAAWAGDSAARAAQNIELERRLFALLATKGYTE
jgi:hypothetical protein